MLLELARGPSKIVSPRGSLLFGVLDGRITHTAQRFNRSPALNRVRRGTVNRRQPTIGSMSISVNVQLISGRSISLEARADETVREVNQRAEGAL